jgi:CBS domain-containing protein
MSPRAAWRLESFGFQHVYDYTGGKVDWLAAGLPTEGPGPGSVRASLVMARDVPTCAPDDALQPVLERTRAAGWIVCVVLNEHGVVQGRLRPDRFDDAATGLVGDAMEPGPATVRAHEDVAAALGRMQKRGVTSLLVTTPEGHLLGVLLARTRLDPE